MNSSAALKAFVGRHGGAVCTSSNARAVLTWALAQHPGEQTKVLRAIQPLSPERVLDQAVRVAGDSGLRTAIGEQARHYVESERAWPQIVSRYINIYEDARRAKQGETNH